jgi:hypothetical protein
MQRKARGVLLALVAVFAMSAVTAAAASATTPEFKPMPTKKKFTSNGGVLRMTWGDGEWILECAKGSTTGEVTGSTAVGKVVVTLTGCEGSINTGATFSSVSSKGAKAGEIVTVALTGELGTVASAEAASGVGLRLKPETGKALFHFAEGVFGEEAVSGSVASEVALVGKDQATNELGFKLVGGHDAIGKIKLDSGLAEEPKLTMGSSSGTLSWKDGLTFEEALEVT